MILRDVLAVLDAIAPPHFAQPWDNVGLLLGDEKQIISKAVLCIDYTAAVADEARELGVQLVFAYHPPLFKPIKTITASGKSALLYDAARRGVAIYSPHTALDVANGGTNDVLADIAGLVDRRSLKAIESAADEIKTLGLGRIGRIETPMLRSDFIDQIKKRLGLSHLLIAGPIDSMAETAAVCAGSCGDYLDLVIAAKADIYLTGEMKHHDALRATAADLTVICTLHSNSERITLATVARRLREQCPTVQWALSQADRDPFSVR